uniref:ATP synthase mitochondrial F1 complex assembly factor 1 n=1 Tax=Lygus hesperus TaxID=30085 RepID=A0A0A9YU51_LYGHE
MAFPCLKRVSLQVPVIFRRCMMTSSWNSARAMEELEKNPYFDKYAQKINELKESDKSKFLERLKACDVQKSSEEVAAKVLETKKPKDYPAPRKAGTFQRRQLKDIMNVDLLVDKTPEDISNIWKEHYRSKDHVIYGSLTKAEFDGFIHNCRRYPIFVVPLPRGDGFEFFMVQFQDDEFHITPLILYQKYREDSPESLCVSYFTDLSQDIVLFLGEYDKKVITPLEATCLLNSVQLFYHSKDRIQLVKTFNESPKDFDYNELLAEIGRLSLEKQ